MTSHEFKPRKASFLQDCLAVLAGEVLLARSFVLWEEKELLPLPGCALVLGKGSRYVGNRCPQGILWKIQEIPADELSSFGGHAVKRWQGCV